MCNLAVGAVVQGKSGQQSPFMPGVTPPRKYDTMVDNETAPTTYVATDPTQLLPLFVLGFEDVSSGPPFRPRMASGPPRYGSPPSAPATTTAPPMGGGASGGAGRGAGGGGAGGGVAGGGGNAGGAGGGNAGGGGGTGGGNAGSGAGGGGGEAGGDQDRHRPHR